MTDALTRDEVAQIFAAAMRVVVKMDEDEHDSRKFSSAIPRDVLTWGEAMTLVPAAMILAAALHPELLDPETLRDIVHNARPALVN